MLALGVTQTLIAFITSFVIKMRNPETIVPGEGEAEEPALDPAPS